MYTYLYMITRRLNYNDLDKIDELIDLRWKQVHKKRNSTHNITLKKRIREYILLSNNIDNNKNIEGLGQVFGCFDDEGSLISFLTQKFWRKMPIHYLGNMTVRPKVSNLYNIESIGLGKCWDDAVKFAESNKFYQWYWITEIKGWNKREEEWFKNSSAFKRYHIFIDSMYHKFEKGQFKYQNMMLGEAAIANTTVAIKYAILKPKFLHNIFQQKGYLKDDFIPIQYSNLHNEHDKQITYKEIKDFNEIVKVTKDESNMLVEKEYYQKNFPDIAEGEHKHFGAYENEKLIGTSSMIKYYDNEDNKKKIYHLWSWTQPNYRRKKIWLNLMKLKANCIKKNNWCEDNTLNIVTVSKEDTRYKNIGWLEAYEIDKTYKEKSLKKTIWYSLWKNYKNI